jgi:hypothetical protein
MTMIRPFEYLQEEWMDRRNTERVRRKTQRLDCWRYGEIGAASQYVYLVVARSAATASSKIEL